MRVYIVAPYTNGDPFDNVQRVIEVANWLIEAGHHPFVPHLSHFIHEQFPHPWEIWMAIDLAWLPFAEAVLWLSGKSKGGDIEVQRARELGIPIYTLDDFFDHYRICR